MLEIRGCKKVGSQVRRKANEALEHIDALSNRILLLEGHIAVQEMLPLQLGNSVKAQFENDLALEQEAVPQLAAAIRENDETTRELLETILIDAESHVDWLESQLHLIAEIGLADYLAQE